MPLHARAWARPIKVIHGAWAMGRPKSTSRAAGSKSPSCARAILASKIHAHPPVQMVNKVEDVSAPVHTPRARAMDGATRHGPAPLGRTRIAQAVALTLPRHKPSAHARHNTPIAKRTSGATILLVPTHHNAEVSAVRQKRCQHPHHHPQ